MSSAIKRLSTIIRPAHPKDKSQSSDKPTADPAEAAPAAPPTESNGTKPVEPSTEQPSTEPAKETSADASPAEAVPGEDTAPVPAATNGDADTPAEKPAEGSSDLAKEEKKDETAESKAESAPASRKERSARDIGRNTIRRFSSILRAQRDSTPKDSVPPVPKSDPSAAIDAPAAPAPVETTAEPPTTDAAPPATPPKTDVVDPKPDTAQPPSTPPKPKKELKEKKDKKDKKDKSSDDKDKDKTAAKRRSSFFQGLQRNRDKAASKIKEVKPKVEAVPKIVKKGAAKGKRVVVVTGASRGPGLEFVKQFAIEPNTFVIALSRSPDKSSDLKSLVSASVKHEHNVRTLRLDATSSKSVATVVKDIVELTDGRIDVLINATESRADPAAKMWDIKGNELEEELQNNLVGPIAITNALLTYLRPMEKEAKKAEEKDKEQEQGAKVEATPEEPAPEEKKDDAPVEADKGDATPDTVEAEGKPAEEAASTGVDAKAETPAEAEAEKTQEEAPSAVPADTTAAAPQEAGPSAVSTDGAAAPQDKTTTSEEKAEAAITTDEAPVQETAEPAVAAAAPEPEPQPSLPSIPYIVFLAPHDPIANQNGAVPTGDTFAPAPRNLYSISRAGLQVAIAKYALGLASRGIGIVGIERAGVNDPHAKVSEEDAVKGVLKLLPNLTVSENGKLLRSDL